MPSEESEPNAVLFVNASYVHLIVLDDTAS